MNELINKIHELNGLVKSMERLAEMNGEYEHPFLEDLSETTKDLIKLSGDLLSSPSMGKVHEISA
jgi:hypothetical protein